VAGLRRLPGSVEHRWQWQARAACQGVQSSTFFHPEYERGENRRRRVVEAKAICRCCPVLRMCREHALQGQERYGIWGGLSEEERTDHLRARQDTIGAGHSDCHGMNAAH